MRASVPASLERYRLTSGPMASHVSYGMSGFFVLPGPCGTELRAMISDGKDWPFDAPAWEHVSISTAHRTPNWKEMEHVRTLFWNDEELVLQFSMPRSQHINIHPYCLHLWKPIGVEILLPPPLTVGGLVEAR